jgi:autophagy-related protein 5
LEDAVRRFQDYGPPSFAFGKVMQVQESDHYLESHSIEEDKDKRRDGGGSITATEHANEDTATSMFENNSSSLYPVCWFEDEATQQPLKWQYFVGVLFDSIHYHTNGNGNDSSLPWKIRLHFNSYPTHTLLELDPCSPILTTVERTFKNSLKQALVLLHGNNKVALNLSKQSHQSIWKAIEASEYDLYKPILLQELQPKENLDLKMIPIRLWMDPTTPMIQRRWDNATPGKNSSQTLGALLYQWVPQYFEKGKDDETFLPKNNTNSWWVAGVKPPLSSSLLDLWRTLSYPDNFLYICVKRG